MTPSPAARRDKLAALVAAAAAAFYFGAWRGGLAVESPQRYTSFKPYPPPPLGRLADDWLIGALPVGASVWLLVALTHPYRRLGVIAPAAVLLAAASAAGLVAGQWPGGLGAAAGLAVGVIAAAGFSQNPRTPGYRAAESVALLQVAVGVGLAAVGLTAADLARQAMAGLPRHVADRAAGAQLLAVSVGLAVWCVWRLRRPFVELAVEVLVRPMYRLNAAGPGVAAFPADGPVVVVANHAAYLDPLFLAGFVPRPTTPMMTAAFFDKPVIRPLMVYVFDTIRVPEAPLKRDTPEIARAIAALGAGKCLVVFPEGYLRRKEEVPLRRFGRGVWEILRAHPDVPVVACWIEGGWGSYFSFMGGPPMAGKRPDVRRRIGVGVAAPEPVPADVLADHLATRRHLMGRVLAARGHLGLDPLVVDLPVVGEAD